MKCKWLYFFFSFLFFFRSIISAQVDPVPPPSPSIVFIHLGSSLPEHLSTAVLQARLFNSDAIIYILANRSAIKKASKAFNDSRIKFISCESLPQSKSHRKFLSTHKLDKKFRKGFWRFTVERFFYLSSFLKHYKLSDVFHLENDVMLYRDLQELLPLFKKHYQNMIGATFDNDDRCIPGFIYISNTIPLEHFTHFISKKAQKSSNDMESLAKFQKQYRGKWIDNLPILMPEYTKNYELISPTGLRGTSPEHFCNHFEKFHSIFDAAAIGQYLGGTDPWHGHSNPGFINESCVFNPTNFKFLWKKDEQGRKIPIIEYQNQQWKINNLHIHSKNLSQFKSNE